MTSHTKMFLFTLLDMSHSKKITNLRRKFSEGTDVNKTSASKECDACHDWYLLNCSFKF